VPPLSDKPATERVRFNRFLNTARKKHKDNPAFVDYDTTLGEVQDASSVLKSVIKGVYNDPRTPMDTEDIDAIRKANAAKKTRKK